MSVTKERVAEILNDAATFIENNRWIRGTWWHKTATGQTQVCAVGAIELMVANTYGYSYKGSMGTACTGSDRAVEAIREAERAETAANKSVELFGPRGRTTPRVFDSIMELNDSHSTQDKRVVVRALRRAAQDVTTGKVLVDA